MATIPQVLSYVTHVIFDMDGLLLNTEELYKHGISTVLKKYGCEYPDQLRSKVLGSQPPDMMSLLFNNTEIGEKSGKTKDEIYQEIKDVYTPLMSSVEWMPGAVRLIKHLHKHNILFAIATSSAKDSFEVKTTNHKDMMKYFHHIVLGSADPEVKKGKPAPDIFLVAAKRFPDSPHPSKCLVFEDAPAGVQGAKAAGMNVVMVPDEIIPQEKKAMADICLKSLEDFKPEVFGLPPFDE